MLDSPTQHYSAMLSRGDSHDIPDQDFIPRTPAREIFRQPSDAFPQTISDRGGYSYSARPTELHAESPRVTFSFSGGDGSGSGSGVGMVAAAPVALARPSMMERNIEAVREPTGAGFVAKTQHYKARYRRWPGVVLLLAIVIGGAVGITFAALHTKTASTARQEAYAKRKASASSITGAAMLLGEFGGSSLHAECHDASHFGICIASQRSCSMRRHEEEDSPAASLITSSEMLSSPTYNYSAMLNREDSRDIPEQDFIPQAPAREVFREPSDAQTYGAVGGYGTHGTNRFSAVQNSPRASQASNTGSGSGNGLAAIAAGGAAAGVFTRGSLLDRNIEPAPGFLEKTQQKYKGRYRMWPGILLLILVIGGAVAGITFSALHTSDTATTRQEAYAQRKADSEKISGGASGSGSDLISDDGADAADYPLTFGTENKVVYAPHYYTPAVYPQAYFYDGGTQDSNGAIADYVEIDDDTLKARIKATMADMFGFLADDNSSALLLGEFGGLYSKDLHPELTTQRCTELSMEVIVESGWAGGFVWSLNPESAYQYNPADTYGTFTEGILEDDWLTANSVFLKGMTALDDLANLRMMPCFEVEESSSGSESSSSS
ncbi:Endoglucanase [Phytophthora ramorum]|uniref:Endoglucanase n=1 Tax=Phytophthora ramorum TaxID=164328 RepID=UPI0030AA35D4|nr:Endoglucanase [Phytophthora ramorum]